MMKSCSFSVVHSSLHVADSEGPVVTLSVPSTAMESMALIISESFEGSVWVLRPRSWSEMRSRRFCLAERDWSVRDERVRVRVRDLRRVGLGLGFGGLKGVRKLEMAGRERVVAMGGFGEEDGGALIKSIKWRD